jgi:glycerate kinase
MTPPRAVCAPDKLRGALDAPGAAAALAAGARAAGWDAVEHPLADGGEGTLDVLLAARGGERIAVQALDALGRPCAAEIGVLADGTAVVETASAIGLAQLEPAERDPLRASSAGAAPLVRAALDAGARRIVLCLGGSASVDGGLGLLAGLGAAVRDADGRPLAGTGADLDRVAVLERGGLDERLDGVELVVAADVTSPLTGPQGAAPVFGPQKGATPAMVKRLDAGLARLAPLLGDAAAVEGAGAAGGLGAACAWLGAAVVPGAGLVIAETGLPALLDGAALCLTAEGRIDASTLAGKTVARVVEASVAAGVPCVAIGGALGPGNDGLYALGARAVLAASSGPGSLRDALDDAAAELARVARAACGLTGAPRP